MGLDVDVDKKGRILVAVTSDSSPTRRTAQVRRYRANGAVDRSYETDGVARVASGSELTVDSFDVTPAGGAALLLGRSKGSDRLSDVRRLSRTGAADRTFGDNGVLTVRLQGYTQLRVSRATV